MPHDAASNEHLLPLLQHVEAFAKIVNVSQTLQLHEWNAESLLRATQWARFLERGTRQYDAGQQQQLDALLHATFPAMTLPSFARGDEMNTHALQSASQHLTRSLLQSPFLASHPIRSEMLRFIMKQSKESEEQQRQQRTTANGSYELKEPLPVLDHMSMSAIFTERIALDQEVAALAAIAQTMSAGCKPIRVQALSRTISVPPVQSYTFLPRTLQLKTIAKSLQQNVVSAKTLSSSQQSLHETYPAFLSELKKLFRDSSSSSSLDVKETVVVMVTSLEWAENMQSVRDDIKVQILEDWLSEEPQQLWRFHPWLSALLAAQSPAIRSLYIAELFQHGFLEPSASEFSIRVATLLLQSSDVEAETTAALQKLDPFVLEKHFGGALEN